MFAGRLRELAALQRLLTTDEPALILVTGARRIGKSRLVREACVHGNVINFRAGEETPRLSFQAFKRACLRHLPDADLDVFGDWQGLLGGLAAEAARSQKGLTLVIDNFSSLSDADAGLPLIIRNFWRSGAAEAGAMKLVLIGENIARMTELTRGQPTSAEHALADCAPELFDLMPLPLQDSAGFFPGYTHEARIAAYAIFGGVPGYLAACDPQKPLAGNILDLLLAPDSRLIDEPLAVLSHGLRDVKVYASILRAIANGHRESGDIRSFVMGAATGMSISSYLERLRALRLIDGERSLDADPKSRYMRFAICDPLTRFWNLFVQPNRGVIDEGGGRDLFENTIKRQLADYMVSAFETICRDFVRSHGSRLFGVHPVAVGQMWGPGYNIPVAGRQPGRGLLVGACAWQVQSVSEAGFAHLAQQARKSGQGPDSLTAPEPDYVLFSRSGFSADLKSFADQSPHLRLLTPADILDAA